MNDQSGRCICIVAAPDLREISQHCTVKTAAATTAAFKKDVRVRLHNTVQYPIQSQNVSVINLPLLICRVIPAVDITDITIVIPLDVIDAAFIQHCIHGADNIITYIRSRQIQTQLVTASSRRPSRYLQTPVRMRAVQIRILVHHFRLEPETELHTDIVQLFRKCLQTTGKFLLIYHPVTQSGFFIIPGAEPAIVQHKHVGAQLFGKEGRL